MLPCIYDKFLNKLNIKNLNIILPIVFLVLLSIVMPKDDAVLENNNNNINIESNEKSVKSEKIAVKKSNKKKSTSVDQRKKEYKICSEEYNEYIKSTIKKISEENSTYAYNGMRYYFPYMIFALHADNSTSDDILAVESEKIKSEVFDEFKKNNYSSKCGLKYHYEYINLEFYSNDEMYEFGQYNVLDIKNYTDYNKYKDRNKR